MHASDLVSLVGTKGSDPQLVDWFEQLGIGKPPVSVTANQGTKSVKDKRHEMEYCFGFDIINDRFYPPVDGPRGGLLCHLQSVLLFSRKPKGNVALPAGFWDGFVGPDAGFDACMTFFEGNVDTYTDTQLFQKPLGADVELKLWFCPRKQRVETIQVSIVQDRQFMGHHEFDQANVHNTVKPAATLVVKWLFDGRHLRLPDGIYAKGLADDHAGILEFVRQHLNGHVWASQLNDDPVLRQVLSHTQTSRSLKLSNGESLELFAQTLYLRSAGAWDAYQAIYSDDSLDDWAGSVDRFRESVVLDAGQRQVFVGMLHDAYRLVAAAAGRA